MSESEREVWRNTKNLVGKDEITLGPYYTYNLRHTPRRLLFTLSYYKFAAKMIGENQSIVELGCGEAMGSPILSEFSSRYLGIDFDEESIAWAKRNFEDEKRQFKASNFVGTCEGTFDAVASLDVIEHIEPERDALYWETVVAHLAPGGTAVIGTPSLNSQKYASAVSKAGHINVYDHTRMLETANKHFRKVLLFSANDEVVHTGYYPMAHYLIAVCIGPKQND
ncbi:class I SAM-dependent methyltransferase [Pelagicoccus sp. NFK12]|uniref:Class I SAM-dependent methyltransferase n=1 Tax=Pelagicoccus enzymogenes TaxID=2773457 RepID=A0A927FCS5_9BACT|nr:class I SAM-dependent methyltransferase [Pelagicoccus enzymogenes]MBD5781401.1 class I SAM-dependent methyltransferase [Pelagicoccus enzymogenes]MDQ8199175.1 class I SAM-dependent methyltransferase [Pelagicoccus enzymogenes]